MGLNFLTYTHSKICTLKLHALSCVVRIKKDEIDLKLSWSVSGPLTWILSLTITHNNDMMMMMWRVIKMTMWTMIKMMMWTMIDHGGEIRPRPDSEIDGISVGKVDSPKKPRPATDHHEWLKNGRALKSVRNTDVMFSLVQLFEISFTKTSGKGSWIFWDKNPTDINFMDTNFLRSPTTIH